MQTEITRRALIGALGFGVAAAHVASPVAGGAPKRRLKIGQTSINWGFKAEDAGPGIRDSARLGYWGYEAFGKNLDAVEADGSLGRNLAESGIPLPSAYFDVNLSDPAQRAGVLEKAIRWGKILVKHGGRVAVIGPNRVDRPSYDFRASKAAVVTTLNEIGKALADLGLVTTMHQHTQTCIETRDEVYAVLDAVDTRVVKFGPDVGQLANGGSDPVKVLTDFLPLLRSIHLKDFLGGPHWAGYCPLGQGKVDIPAVMDVLERSATLTSVMVELDATPNAPMTPFECARASKEYLLKLGYEFRT
jgi:inosose dehydratase